MTGGQLIVTKRRKIIEALQLFEELDPDGDVWTGHDQFSVGGEVDLTSEQHARLVELGFQYDAELGWFCFT